MTKKVVNTSKDEIHPEWVLGGNPGAIEAQEARGQQQLVNSELLPVDIGGDKERLEALGIVFGQPLPDDPLFCRALLPPGWKKVATEHSMWSDIVDETGVARASVFYKAAFYDRRAFICAK